MPEPGSQFDAKLASILLKIIVAGGAAATAPMVGGPGAAAIGSAGTQLVERMTRDWAQQGARNANRTLQLAAEQAEMDVGDFGDQIVVDPGTRHVATRVIAAAADTVNDQKLRLLARILSSAVQHPELVETETLIAVAVSQLEAVHLRLLATVSAPPPVRVAPTKRPLRYWSGGLIHDELGWQPAVINGVLLVLQAAGTVWLSQTSVEGGGPTYGSIANTDLLAMAVERTPFGQMIIDRASGLRFD